jgi:predicted nicotinamide N-methyase
MATSGRSVYKHAKQYAKELHMSAGRKPHTNKQEQHAFGLTILRSGHPEVRRLQHAGVQPSLHGQKIWRSSFLLMDYLHQRGINTPARVLDIGCGWSLPGIYCAKTFNAQVSGFDADAAVFPYLNLHAQLNGVRIHTRQLSFAQIHCHDLAPFDLIVGADICFWDELVNPLFDIVRHGIKAGVKEILLADPDRPPFDDLRARCQQACDTEVLDWEMSQPVAASGLILRIVGNL